MRNANSIGNSIKRLPGQSLREERIKVLDRLVNDPAMLMMCGVTAFILECLHVWGKIQPHIYFGVLCMLAASAFVFPKWFKARRELRNYRRGEEGERIVAQAIEKDLLPKGYTVFHDIPLEKNGQLFNLDHVLIGPNGIFVIETKNYSKPAKGRATVSYDGKTLLWNGKRHTKDEAMQVMAEAKSAKEYIDGLTGLSVYVKPVLCAVSWFADSTNLYGHPVLLVMEKTLGSVIPKVSPNQTLTEAQRNQIIAALMRTE